LLISRPIIEYIVRTAETHEKMVERNGYAVGGRGIA